MKYFKFWVLLTPFILSTLSCTAETPKALAKTEPCDFNVNAHSQPQFATYANDLNIPYDQEKLVQFMWVDIQQSECFAKQYAPVKIYKVPSTNDSGVFTHLPDAPAEALKSWSLFEKTSGSTVNGLTTFFSSPSGQDEKIVKSFILVRSDSSSWHLWHEFSHFIIGSERANHHDQNIAIAEQAVLAKARTEALTYNSNEDLYSKKLHFFLNQNNGFITKRFVDEIVIEATLIHLALQNGSTPQTTNSDIRNATNLIQFFAFQMNFQIVDSLNTIHLLREHPLTKAQMDLLTLHEDRLLFLRKNVNTVIDDTAALTGSSLIVF